MNLTRELGRELSLPRFDRFTGGLPSGSGAPGAPPQHLSDSLSDPWPVRILVHIAAHDPDDLRLLLVCHNQCQIPDAKNI